MNRNQKTLANAKRTRVSDRADVARLTAVPSPSTDLVARLATAPGLVRPGVAHWDVQADDITTAFGDLLSAVDHRPFTMGSPTTWPRRAVLSHARVPGEGHSDSCC
jgi:hypothetical protein